jgi:hypothetical protein
VPYEYEYSSSKRMAFQMNPQKQNGDFLENGCNDFDYISVSYGDYLAK